MSPKGRARAARRPSPSTLALEARATQRAHAVVLLFCALAAALWSKLALARFSTVHNHTFDLAEYARLAWGLAHGQPWDAVMGGHVLGGHMPWVLSPLGMLARALGGVFSTAQVLLVAQALCMAFSAYFVFRVALRVLGRVPAVLFALAYLAYPNLGHVAAYEMHPGSLALLPLAWAFDLLDAQREVRPPRAGLFACACALIVACRASLGLEVFALCALAVWQSREHATRLRSTALITGALAFAYLAASMLVLRPAFGGGTTGSFDAHFGPWGGSPFGIVHALLTRPGDVFAHLAAPERVRYLPMVLAPFAFLPLLGPRALWVALPSLAINLASVFPTTTRIDSHYLTPAVPALAVAAIHGLRALAQRAQVGPSVAPLAYATLTVALLAHAIAGGAPWSLDFIARDFVPDARTRAAQSMLVSIPDGGSVQAPDPLLPHLAERRAVHRAPPPDRNTAFVVLDLDHRRRYARSEDLLRTREEPLARRFLAREDLAVLAYANPYVLLARGHNPRAGYVRRYFIARERAAPTATDQALTDCVALRSAVLREDRVLDLFLRASGPCPEDLALRLGYGARPSRVDLPCDGLLSPAHWRAGDLLRSPHVLSAREHKAAHTAGLWVAALRSSGARPNPEDPSAVPVTIAYGR
jgi:uncharacterized membrane protein